MSRFSKYSLCEPDADLRATPRRHLRDGLPRLEQGRLPGPQGRARHRDLRPDALHEARLRTRSPTTPPPHPDSASASPTSSTSPRWTPFPGTDAATVTARRTDSPTPTAPTNNSRPSCSATTSSSSTSRSHPACSATPTAAASPAATGQASHVEFATLAHETTHVLLHFPADRATRPDLTTRETEAEAVTYLLCAQLGIAGTDASDRVHPVLPRHARHAGRLARAHPRHRTAALGRARRDSLRRGARSWPGVAGRRNTRGLALRNRSKAQSGIARAAQRAASPAVAAAAGGLDNAQGGQLTVPDRSHRPMRREVLVNLRSAL